MFDPGSTYRIQFHNGFTFKQFEATIPYLATLGIKTIYASPIFKSTPGSMHGYDVVDPLTINPEIGTLSQLRSIHKKLKLLNISWLQDIVPNHMAYHPDNHWLMDVLEKGSKSVYADYFDILWDSPVHNGQLMVPFLGKPWQEAVVAGEIKVGRAGGKLVFDYFGQHYPLNLEAYRMVLQTSGKPDTGLLTEIDRIISIKEPEVYATAFERFFKDSGKQLSRKLNGKSLSQINNAPAAIYAIASAQIYRLCFWQETNTAINYRRFFTVNGLICLNMQQQKVFDHYHSFIKKLLDDGIIQGLRVDHIDGLYDPKTYLERLRGLAGPDAYIVVEKILEAGEQVPADWPVQGNTGYDMLTLLNRLFTSLSGNKFSAFYKEMDASNKPVQERIWTKKKLILETSMRGELENLYRLLRQISSGAESEQLKTVIGEFLIHCPVYRFYANRWPLDERERSQVDAVLTDVIKRRPALESAARALESAMLSDSVAGASAEKLHFYMRLMQFAGPLMAKGVEDTLMYSFNRFINHNEVGDAPGSPGIKAEQFHAEMIERQKFWPLSMSATATHDTKRGEDVRARLNVLSDSAEEWIERVTEWRKLTKAEENGITANDEYFIYQTIIGAHPMPGKPLADFPQRLKEYLIKALREGKENSDWANPDEAYEKSAVAFALSLLKRDSRIQKSFLPFFKKVADYGIINSLAQVLLKFTCPGVPDLYQGCEPWDLSMVDPDNRRPVDYAERGKFLNNDDLDWAALWQTRYNGEIKLKLTQKLLVIRNKYAALFSSGEYIPVELKGPLKDNALAFVRRNGSAWLLTIVPLHLAALYQESPLPLVDWRNTRVILPDGAPLKWQNLLTGSSGYNGPEIPLGDVLNKLPIAVLKLEPAGDGRGAGILMHITSLPGPFPSGDIGPSAYRFADFLVKARQKYWQMLPVNPVSAAAGYSPYSAESSMAGNVLLISPEILVADGLLDDRDIHLPKFKNSDRADFSKSKRLKQQLFLKAFFKFLDQDKDITEFQIFKQKEAGWLDDYALYCALKEKFRGKGWYTWPGEYKLRNKRALIEATSLLKDSIEQTKWLQYIFSRQWAELKTYCNQNQVTLVGDMPFYVSHDSADVWANRDIFNLDKDGRIAGMAGVPPDYFSAGGQLWGMPVYRWDVLKEKNYDWWLRRIRKNLEYFDLIRLDHFRAFSEYWEVPAGHKNAIGGKWMPGPRADFFNVVNRNLGRLPFVAEDLGEIDDAVYQLRDKFNLPGMRVLQFAFDASMPVSPHIPHNYVPDSFAYAGTHDNSTTRGWFSQDLKPKDRKRIEQYIGRKLYAREIHLNMIRLCYGSIAKTTIIPMQDVLGLDGSARMNVPASKEGNWSWRMNENGICDQEALFLQNLVIEYNR